MYETVVFESCEAPIPEPCPKVVAPSVGWDGVVFPMLLPPRLLSCLLGSFRMQMLNLKNFLTRKSTMNFSSCCRGSLSSLILHLSFLSFNTCHSWLIYGQKALNNLQNPVCVVYHISDRGQLEDCLGSQDFRTFWSEVDALWQSLVDVKLYRSFYQLQAYPCRLCLQNYLQKPFPYYQDPFYRWSDSILFLPWDC